MDKYEYRVRAEQIKSLLAEHAYAEAKEVCDTIDWKRVKNFSMLCTVSEIYKINRDYEDARDILLLAYDRYPSGKKIVYALCELAIKMNEPVQAIEYYKEFCQIAPKDTGKYILQYKIYEAQDVTLEERIAVLEEFKKKEYRERWAYELARLYDLIGAEAKCVEECDELILWFGEGKYVQKALELKMRHKELTASQQIKYDRMTGIDEDEEFFNESESSEDTNQEFEDEQIQEEETMDIVESEPEIIVNNDVEKQPTQEIPAIPDEDGIIPTADPNTIQVKPVNVGEYSTMNLQAEISKSLQELLGEDDSINENTGMRLEKVEEPVEEISNNSNNIDELIDNNPIEFVNEIEREPNEIYAPVNDAIDESAEVKEQVEEETIVIPQVDSVDTKIDNTTENQMDSVLAQEYDGQISLVVPEPEMVEKQITGQIDISEYLADWDKQCKESQRERIAGAIRKSMENTNHILLPLEKILPGITGPLPEVEEIAKRVVLPTDEPVNQDSVSDEYDSNSIEEDPGIEEIEEIEDTSNQEEFEEEFFEEETAVSEEVDIPDIDYTLVDSLEEDIPEENDIPEESEDDIIEDIDASEEFSEDISEEDEIPEEFEEEIPEEVEEEEIPEENIEEFSECDELENNSEEAAPEDADTEEDSDDEGEDDSDEVTDDTNEEVEFSQEEMEELFGSLLKIRKVPGRIKLALKKSGMEPLFGNIVITGNEKDTRIKLALGIAKCKQRSEVEFEGKVAKISAKVLNSKDVSKALKALNKGALLVEDAGALEAETLDQMTKTLSSPDYKMLVILEDKKSAIEKLAGLRTYFEKMYDVRINIPAYSNQDLVSHAKEYALEREYTIDEMGVLELYTRIDELQTSNHFVTISEVEEIMDKAIAHVNKKNLSHLRDVLFAKRYDENDLIILRDKDFVNI